MEKVWKKIMGYPDYSVSDHGDVRRDTPGMGGGSGYPGMLIKTTNNAGYRVVGLSGGEKGNRKRVMRHVHRLVLENHGGPRPEGMECAHNNGKRDDNRLSNLRWATQKDNIADKKRHGTWQRGQKIGNARYTDKQVRALKVALMPYVGLPKLPYGVATRLGREFDMRNYFVSGVFTGKRWGWLEV